MGRVALTAHLEPGKGAPAGCALPPRQAGPLAGRSPSSRGSPGGMNQGPWATYHLFFGSAACRHPAEDLLPKALWVMIGLCIPIACRAPVGRRAPRLSSPWWPVVGRQQPRGGGATEVCVCACFTRRRSSGWCSSGQQWGEEEAQVRPYCSLQWPERKVWGAQPLLAGNRW